MRVGLYVLPNLNLNFSLSLRRQLSILLYNVGGAVLAIASHVPVHLRMVKRVFHYIHILRLLTIYPFLYVERTLYKAEYTAQSYMCAI